jgi:hypothetical protein
MEKAVCTANQGDQSMLCENLCMFSFVAYCKHPVPPKQCGMTENGQKWRPEQNTKKTSVPQSVAPFVTL